MEKNILDFCEIGNLNEVERCLNEGTCPNFQNNEGDSPLQVASANGYLDIVALLIQHGAVIDLHNNYGWTPLMHAAKYGHTSTVAFLLEKKAKINISNKLGVNAMLAAVYCGNYSTVKLLVEAGGMIAHVSAGNANNECDLSSVMAASLYGNDSILQILMGSGVDVNHASPVTGLTPLMLAACGDHKYIINMLMELGADASKKDICGRTALDLAEIFNNSVAKTCLESLTTFRADFGSSQNNDLLQAVKKGDILNVKSILEENPHFVNISNPNDGVTPLILTSILGNYDIANLLLSYGANINATDVDNGWTPLMHAVFHKHSDVVQLLVEMGADVDICSSNGYTVVDLLQQNDSLDPTIMEMLSPRLSSYDGKSSILVEDASIGERLSAPERLHSKRSASQTRVKDFIGGVAQNLQNKMLTHLSPRPSEVVPNIEVTSADDSDSEVFLEEETLSLEEYDIEKCLPPTILPPDLYLANILKEHKVEALTPPFPPTSTFTSTSSKKPRKKTPGEKSSKPPVNFLRVPHLLKSYTKKKCIENANRDEFKRNHNAKKRYNSISLLSLSDTQNKKESFHSAPEEEKNSSLQIKETHSKSEEKAHSKNSPGELTILLNKESLQKYVETFRDQEVDMETFQHLTETDLNEIGIQSLESQKKLMEVIKKLQVSK